MPLSIPSYPDPQDSTTPITDAYAYTAGISLDLSLGTGNATLNVYRTTTAAQNGDIVVTQEKMAFGQVIDDTKNPPVVAPTVQEFLMLGVDDTLKATFEANPCVKTAWDMIMGVLDKQWTLMPTLANSVETP